MLLQKLKGSKPVEVNIFHFLTEKEEGEPFSFFYKLFLMFKKGDRIICINNSTDIPNVQDGQADYRDDVELGKVYIVTDLGSRGESMQIRKEGTTRDTQWYVPVSAFVYASSIPKKIQAKAGDYVELLKTLPAFWLPEMSKFLSKIVKVTRIYEIAGAEFFEFEGSKPYFFDAESISKVYTEKEYLQYLEIRKESPQNINDVYQIAKEVYPEDRVELSGNSIIIYFPHVRITNGKRNQSHDIYDIFVKLDVKFITSKNGVNVDMYGKRMSYTLDELKSSYCHSHLSFNGCEWGNFCLGSSQFAIIKRNMYIDEGNTNTNWKLMFYSIPKYLEWESIEGGPYRLIEQIKPYDQGGNIGFNFNNYKSIFKEFPLDLLDATSSGISINNTLGFNNFIKQKSPLKTLKKDSTSIKNELTKAYYDQFGRAYITFNGKKIPFKVIEKEVEEKIQPSEVSSDVISMFKAHIEQHQYNFNRELNNNYAKDKFYSKLFGQAGIE